MNEYQQANEIARMLKQKRHRKNHAVGGRVSFEMDGMKKMLTTKEAAQALNRSTQTLHLWAMESYTKAPIKPVRICGRLAWSADAIAALLNGDVD
ncbi:hypothetical protein [Pseudomonas sp.]|uniref:hypothetical protein n=1 Tax=Pseudomonas sp. TaxID=306 RepID=UPI00258D2A22|nr:hypothetical protein [Pseudomonas sp.]